MGYALFRLGQPAEAIGWYRKAIDLAPDLASPYEGMGAAQMALRNWNAAEASYKFAAARDPNNPAIWQALGDAAGEQDKASEAIADYRKAQEQGASNAALYRSLGWQLSKTGRYAEAEQALLEATRLDPRDANALVSLGAVLERQGRTAEAKRAWQRAVEADPDGPSAAMARQNLAAFERPVVAPAASGATPLAAPAAAPATPVPVASEPAAPPSASKLVPPPGSTAGDRPKATVAIGDFQVKAATAGQYVGDGLREMLVTALFGNGNFIVVERMDLKGLAAEQALSRSRLARPDGALPEGQMDIAEIMVYGAVTEFEPETRGGGLTLGMPNVPMTLGLQGKSAHMAVDVRVVDVATGRVLATTRIVGEAHSVGATIGANISARGVTMPATLGAYANTPMEQAIRETIEKATAYVVTSTPPQYFRHR
jgi:curli biogenesis system outer membrane secretion channel CsgG/Flp pilus assembly protein TadD